MKKEINLTEILCENCRETVEIIVNDNIKFCPYCGKSFNKHEVGETINYKARTRDYVIVTLVVQNGKVVNLQVFENETEGVDHAEYCLMCYGDEQGTTQVVSFKHYDNGDIEVIWDLSYKIGRV